VSQPTAHERAGNGGADGRHDPERAMVLVPVLKTGDARAPHGRHSAARLEEAVGLAEAIDLDVVEALAVPLADYRPATLFGSGKVDEIAGKVTDRKAGLVIVDHALTPVQQRNLEKAWKAKVIDRTGLILEIFGDRAHTREGRLQVELAHLVYQKGRLVRSWTHLERQRGGFGFLGGPGETQIEADRRVITDRIAKIERELQTVVTRRRLQRDQRKRSSQPVVALVGYTNAGKSTLFNTLTRAEVFADNRLFATLDPTLRRIELPGGASAILSDTVGFVADLPTTLVAAFRATLEEVSEADLILHVRDIADPDSEAQAADVAEVLAELGIDANDGSKVIEVWNKIDLIPEDRRPAPAAQAGRPAIVLISALKGEGIPTLLEAVEHHLSQNHQTYRVTLAGEALANLHRLYDLGEVTSREELPDGSVVAIVRVSVEEAGRLRKIFPAATRTRDTGATES
jgi:GTP-binding protein HflX